MHKFTFEHSVSGIRQTIEAPTLAEARAQTGWLTRFIKLVTPTKTKKQKAEDD